MKHLTNRFLLFILTASFSLGCADLDEKPVGLLAPEALFRTAKDVETAVFGAMAGLRLSVFTADNSYLH